MNNEVISLPNANGRNDRFRYEKIHQDGEWFFVKTALTPELKPNLKREFLWADFLNHIALHEPDAHVRAPHMIGFDKNGGLMMEYIDAQQVASPCDASMWKAKLERYARMLTLLDTYAEDYDADWPQDPTANLSDPKAVWRRWFGDYLENAQPLLGRAFTVYNESKEALTFRVQHGDLTPWQIFEQGNEWIIYDGEKAGDHLPRYNDLSYGYGRLFTRLKDPTTAAELLEKFLEYSGINHEDFFEQFLPIMTLRATGMLADAYSDRTHDDYYEEAVSLMNLCFEKSLDSFLPKKSR